MEDIVAWSAVETVARLKARDVSAVEVCAAHLARLDAVNPDINAVVDGVPDAMDRARAMDAGEIESGVLHGAPITTKIGADQKGLATTQGLPALAENIAPGDGAAIANLHAAGAIPVGRTNTPEFSLRWCTSNPLHGITLNPWNSALTPGGSSGGASAAVASGIGVIAHGSDLGGSIRYPSYCCGIVGLRPSLGRVPTFNPTAKGPRAPIVTAMSTHGPMARSVADVRLGLAAMDGYSPDDPAYSTARRNGRRRKTGKLRIGVAPAAFDALHGDVDAAIETAANSAQTAGIELHEVNLPDMARSAELWGQLLFTELQITMAADVANFGSEALQHWSEQFKDHFGLLDLEGYMLGQAERTEIQRGWAQVFETVDAVLLPVSRLPAFANDLEFKQPDKAPQLIRAQEPLYVINLVGLPALAMPTHVANGVPQGVQLVGPMHDDDALLDIGEHIERVMGPVLDQIPRPFRL